MITLLDYRRRVSDLYRVIQKHGTQTPEAFDQFKANRDDLFKSHAQSPLSSDQKASFKGLRYYPYNPSFRLQVKPIPVEHPQTYHVELGNDGQFSMRQFATVEVNLPAGSGTLGVFWIEGYGGGVFIPFRDSTNGTETYGGGRYILDTIKGADLGTVNENELILDFNYAYHPSCYYNTRWVCPLAPPQNKLDFSITAGEMMMK